MAQPAPIGRLKSKPTANHATIEHQDGVWTKCHIPEGIILGKLKGADAIGTAADSTDDSILRRIRNCPDPTRQNVMARNVDNQVYYQTCKEIEAGQELLISNSKLMTNDHIEESERKEISGGFARQKSDVEMREADEGEGELQCGHCGLTFDTEEKLNTHEQCCNKVSHWQEVQDGQKTCEQCGQEFSEISELRQHIQSSHQSPKLHVCPDCGKSFATGSGLKQHTHIHASIKPFTCEVCLKSYTQFSNLCRHKRMHSDCRNQLKCKGCGQKFSTVTALSKHQRFCDLGLRPAAGDHHTNAHQSVLSPAHPYLNFLNPLTTAQQIAAASVFGGANGRFPGLPFPYASGHFLPDLCAGQKLGSDGEASPHSSGMSEGHSPSANDSSPYLSQLMLRRSSAPPLDHPNSSGEECRSARSSPQAVDTDESDCKPSAHPFTISSICGSGAKLSRKLSPSRSGTSPDSSTAGPTPLDLRMPSKRDNSARADRSKSPEANLESPRIKSPTTQADSISSSSTVVGDKSDSPPPADTVANGKAEMFSHLSALFAKNFAQPRFMSPNAAGSDATGDSNVGTPVIPQPLRPPGLLQAASLFDQQFLSAAAARFSPFARFPFPNPFAPDLNFLRETLKAAQQHPYGGGQPGLQHPGVAGFPPPPNGQPLKGKDRYTCRYCGKIFPRSANLTRHLRTHTGEQPYKCQYCERSFSISSNLQRHVRNIHNREKPFKCHMCERCFGQQTNLDRHLKKHEFETVRSGPDKPDSSASPEHSGESVLPRTEVSEMTFKISPKLESLCDSYTKPVKTHS